MATKKAFVSGHNYIQDIHMEPGIYTVLMKVKSMYGDVCSFALFDGTAWTHYDMDTVQGQWKWAYVTFRILEPMTKINLISRNYSAELPVYVVEPQIVAGNVPFDAGVSPADLNKESKELQSLLQSMEYLKLAIGQDAEMEGALFTLVTILLKQNMNADVTAGISGIQGAAKDEPAFWAGGTYDEGRSGVAKAIIRHDGSVKFTDADIQGKLATNELGNRIIIDPASASMTVYNEYGNVIYDLFPENLGAGEHYQPLLKMRSYESYGTVLRSTLTLLPGSITMISSNYSITIGDYRVIYKNLVNGNKFEIDLSGADLKIVADGLPTSTTGLVYSQLYRDSNGFIKIFL